MAEVLELRVIGSALPGSPTSDETFRLVAPHRPRLLDGLAFHATLPFRVARELRDFEPHAVLVQGAHEAAGTLLARRLARRNANVILDVHGDWRTATRACTGPERGGPQPVRRPIAAWAVRVDAVRTVSDFTTTLVRELGVEPAATFPAFMDLAPFLTPRAPLPAEKRALRRRARAVQGARPARRRVAARRRGGGRRRAQARRWRRTDPRSGLQLPKVTGARARARGGRG